MTYVDLRPDGYRPVQVRLDDGAWCDGYLESHRQVKGVWSGFVRYSPEQGVSYLRGLRIRGH